MSRFHLDPGSLITIVLTFVLFVIAIFVHGLTQHLLLEAGVFLVSVKLILMSYKSSSTAKKNAEQLDRIEQMLAASLKQSNTHLGA